MASAAQAISGGVTSSSAGWAWRRTASLRSCIRRQASRRWPTSAQARAILQHVTISANARVGSHVVILPNTVVSHDCTVGDYTCIRGRVSVRQRGRQGVLLSGSNCHRDWRPAHPRQIARRHGVGRAGGCAVQLRSSWATLPGILRAVLASEVRAEHGRRALFADRRLYILM